MFDEDPTRSYVVVVNEEEQYSIWFAEREPPPGWRKLDKSGTKAECLEHIKENWPDIRPLSLRRSLGLA